MLKLWQKTQYAFKSKIQYISVSISDQGRLITNTKIPHSHKLVNVKQCLIFYIYFNIIVKDPIVHKIDCMYLKLCFCVMAGWRSKNPKHVAIKIGKIKN
jgi:hypothetical protein